MEIEGLTKGFSSVENVELPSFHEYEYGIFPLVAIGLLPKKIDESASIAKSSPTSTINFGG